MLCRRGVQRQVIAALTVTAFTLVVNSRPQSMQSSPKPAQVRRILLSRPQLPTGQSRPCLHVDCSSLGSEDTPQHPAAPQHGCYILHSTAV